MRVLLVHGGSDLYGASRSALRLTSRLVRDGHEMRVVLPSEGPLAGHLEKAGASIAVHADLGAVTRFTFASARGPFWLALHVPRSVLNLAREMAHWRPDIVHTNTALIVSAAVAARWRGIPHVWHMREFFGEFPLLWRLYRHYVCGLSDVVVCVSRAVAGQFDSRYGDRVRVLHNGLPASEFDGVSEERVERFRQKFGLDGFKIVGVIGRIKAVRKGQETFVRAAALLKERHPSVRFLLIGSPFPGNEAHLIELRRLINELGVDGQVIYTGDVDDIAAAYAAMDVVVLPSGLPEPFAGVVVEAMACGKPVIGTRLGGTEEQIDDGRTGFLVEGNRAEAIAHALDRLLSNQELCRSMGRNALDRFRQHFEFEAFYSRMMTIYGEARAGHAGRRMSVTST